MEYSRASAGLVHLATYPHIKHGAISIHFSHSLSSGEPRLILTPYTWGRYSLEIDQSLSYATARLLYPQHSLLAQDGVSADTTADNTGVLARFLEDIIAFTRDQELGLLHVVMEPLLSMPTFHAVSLMIHFSWVSVMSTGSSAERSSHGTPVPNSSESVSSTRLKSSGLRTEPWWSPAPTPNIGEHALDDTHSPFVDPEAP